VFVSVSAKMRSRPARNGFLAQVNFSTDFLISQLTKARFRKFLSEVSAISKFLSEISKFQQNLLM